MTGKTDEELQSLRDDLRERGVKYCVGAYVDIHGVPKGKCVPIAHFEDFARGSELYTGYALDGLGQAPNDDEICSMPDLRSITQLPWQPEIAWMPADNYFKGEPYPVNTRVALQKVLAQAAEMGFQFNLGIECEIYVLKQGERGELLVPNADDDLEKSCYDLKRFFDQFPWLDQMVTTMNALGWDVYSFDHEDGNSQFEFDFEFADALTMADRFVFFRLMAKKIAAEHGMLATFMPKPFADKTGNGAHFNMSLADLKTGANLFKIPPAEDPRGLGLSSLGYSFIAGVLRHGQALCAAFAPTVNSYKRLIRRGAMSYYSWAPIFNSFGTNNRTNSIRVPMGGGRCESRNADSSCNPYLAAALVLAAGLEGIREGLDPGDPHNENLYDFSDAELKQRGIQPLPKTLAEAVDAFEADPFIEQVLGTELKNEFVKYKRAEWEEYHLAISQWEIDRYARFFLTMIKVLHIQNGEHDKAGLFQPAMTAAGVQVDYVHPWRGEKVPASLGDYAGLSLGGGAQSVYDAESEFPYLLDEVKLVQEAARSSKPVNGMCLGAQLIAVALGGRAFKNQESEFGLQKVSLLPAASEDSLWSDFPKEFAPVSWHGDTFELPPGGVRLASSRVTENQLFRYGYGIYGLQFHLEIDAPLLKEMVNADREDLIKSGVNPQAFIASGEHELPSLEPMALNFYQRWAALLA